LAQVELDLADAHTRAGWMHTFGERFDQASARLARLGWRVLPLRTDESPDRVLSVLLPHRREAA
ncbi:MAG TPA: hypothetical protein VN259_14340, partial [Xanthomonadales bacterium]|nr:hypothetical protein [Xanthomonadales bacterium]